MAKQRHGFEALLRNGTCEAYHSERCGIALEHADLALADPDDLVSSAHHGGPVSDSESADWTLLQQATEDWASFHEGRDASQPAIRYRDGGSFIVVEDERFGALRHGTFEGVLREVLLECCEIRTREHVERLVADHGGTAEETSVILDHFVANGIMVTEGQRYLSLPVASTPRNAARRIREQHSRNQPKGLRSLNVVSG